MSEPKNCSGCRYWSDQHAMVNSHGELVALCLVPRERDAAGLVRYTRGNQTCESWASGHLGAVDEPGLPAGAYA